MSGITDHWFDELREWCEIDVHRAKRERYSKTKWADEVIAKGDEIAARHGGKPTGDAIKVASYAWLNYGPTHYVSRRGKEIRF